MSVPILLLNIFFYLFRRTILAAYFAALRVPSIAFLQLLSRFSLVNIPVLIFLNLIFSVYVLLLDRPDNHPAIWIFMALSVFTAMMCIHTCKIAIEYREGNRTDLILNLTVLHNRVWIAENQPLPAGIQVHLLSQGTWLGSLMISLFVLGQFLILLIAETGTLPFWLSVNAMLMVLILVDFEMVEHLSAHARDGVLVRIEQPTPFAVVLFALEKIRIYLVWPLYYWAPKRYFLTHTHHHHVENNGPADWQSTLRFDLTSIADFSKSLLWLQSSFLFPVDTARYFRALARRRHLKKLLVASAYNLVLISAVFMIEPLFASLLFCLYVSMAWVFHSFIFAWHGFHDATKPYDVVASNNSPGHYGHHKEPGMHLFSPELKTVYQQDRISTDYQFPSHKSSIAFDVISKNWLLIQCLLWQKKYSVIRQLIQIESLNDDDLYRLVKGLPLNNRHATVKRLDNKLSCLLGSFLEWWLLLITPKDHTNYLKNS